MSPRETELVFLRQHAVFAGISRVLDRAQPTGSAEEATNYAPIKVVITEKPSAAQVPKVSNA